MEILKTYTEDENDIYRAWFEKQGPVIQGYTLKQLHRINLFIMDSQALVISAKRYTARKTIVNTVLGISGEDLIKIGNAMGVFKVIWLNERYKYLAVRAIDDEASFIDEITEQITAATNAARAKKNESQKRWNKKNTKKINDYARTYQMNRRAKLKAEKERLNATGNNNSTDSSEFSEGTSGTTA